VPAPANGWRQAGVQVAVGSPDLSSALGNDPSLSRALGSAMSLGRG
jgi:hypothetical protein